MKPTKCRNCKKEIRDSGTAMLNQDDDLAKMSKYGGYVCNESCAESHYSAMDSGQDAHFSSTRSSR